MAHGQRNELPTAIQLQSTGGLLDEAELTLLGHFESAGGKRWARTIPLRGLFNKSTYSPPISGTERLIRVPLATWLKSTLPLVDRLR